MLCPVPPPPTPRVPMSVFVKVSVEPEPTMVVDAVKPLKTDDEVAKVRFPVKVPCGTTSPVTPAFDKTPPAESARPVPLMSVR